MARVATAGSELGRPVPQPGTSQKVRSAARLVAPLLEQLFNGIPVRFAFWDGSIAGPDSTPGTVVFNSPDALKRLLWAPSEFGLARTFVASRKLGLHERTGMRLLDVGCGWGSMAVHAGGTYGTGTVAVTISPSQAKRAEERVSEAQLGQEVEVRLQDYRDLRGETFDAISSIGMFEHVGAKRMDEYFATLFSLLAPGGRLLNHAISKVGGSKIQGPTFMNRYVFPDGELIDVAEVARAMERAGFEVRDVGSLRAHYALTLRAWVANLDASWAEAVHIVEQGRARVWKLYMSASTNGFEDGGLAVHQVLGVRPNPSGTSGMPRTRSSWG